jgi:hypothetical protein
MAVPAVRKGRTIHATRAPAFADIGGSGSSSRPKTKWGLDRDALYIGGGLAAIGALYYYYATMENARIEKRRQGASSATGSGSPAPADAQSAKGRG